jgi:hypothetical protein
MAQREKLLEYCESNLLLVFKTKPVKERKPANDEVVDANVNGLNLHLCVMVSALQGRRDVITKRRMFESTMSTNMFNFLQSGITKDTSMMFWDRSLSKRNYLQVQVLHWRVHYQSVHPLKIKALKDSCLLKQ